MITSHLFCDLTLCMSIERRGREGTEVDGVYDYDTIQDEKWAFIDVALGGIAVVL